MRNRVGASVCYSKWCVSSYRGPVILSAADRFAKRIGLRSRRIPIGHDPAAAALSLVSASFCRDRACTERSRRGGDFDSLSPLSDPTSDQAHNAHVGTAAPGCPAAQVHRAASLARAPTANLSAPDRWKANDTSRMKHIRPTASRHIWPTWKSGASAPRKAPQRRPGFNPVSCILSPASRLDRINRAQTDRHRTSHSFGAPSPFEMP